MKNYLLLIFLFISTVAVGQAPLNDEPGASVPVTVVPKGSPAVVVNGTTEFATASATPPQPATPSTCGCTSSVPSAARDVWYVINTGTYTDIEITVNSGTYFGAPGYLRIYQNITASGVPVQCWCSNSSSAAVGTVTASGLMMNTNYYLAVAPRVSTSGFWGPFTVNVFGCPNFPTPIDGLLDFNVEAAAEQQNDIKWNVTNEIDVKEFRVQRKVIDRNEFVTIETIPYDSEKSNYLLSDNSFETGGLNYYRLLLITNNNERNYSNVESIFNGQADTKITCYPNPAEDNLTISRNDISSNAFVEIFDVTGKQLFSEDLLKGNTKIKIDCNTWPIGLFWIKYTERNNSTPVSLTWLKK